MDSVGDRKALAVGGVMQHEYRPVPCCPSCGAAMRLVRSIPKIGGLPELESFECRACRVSITEAAPPEVSEMDRTMGQLF
jgi:hypothetical protein